MIPTHRQSGIILKQPAIEPLYRFKTNPATGGHRPKKIPRKVCKLLGPRPCLLQHAAEHLVGEEPHILRKHAEDETVDKVGDLLRRMALIPERICKLSERLRGPLGEGLPGFARPQPLGIRHCPLEQIPKLTALEILQRKLIGFAHGVCPVRPDQKPMHIRNNQDRRILQRQRVLPQLIKGSIKVCVLPLVLPCKMIPFPYIRPAVSPGILACTSLKAVMISPGIGLGRCRLTKQPAQINKVLLCR